MMKFPFKVITLATLATIITATNGSTIHALAQEQTAQEQKIENYALGPEGLKKALAETGSHILVMDLYAKTMIKQPNVNLSNIDLGSGGEELIKNIHLNQELSRINANYWLDTAKPNIQKTARNIVNYDEQFQNYYDTLVDTVKKKDKVSLKEGIGDLIYTIHTNSNEVTEVIKMLEAFKTKLYTNTVDFKNNVGGPDGQGGLTAILAGKQALVPQLQAEIENLRSTQKTHFDNVLAWSIGGGLGAAILVIGTIAGAVVIVVTGGTATPAVVGGLTALGAAGIGLGTAAGVEASNHMNSYNEISNKIGELSMKADLANQAVISLTNTKDTLTYLYQTVDQAIMSLTSIQQQWNKMGANYKDLYDNIDQMQEHKLSLIPDDLKAAKQSWNDIHKDAEFISKDIAFKQEKTN
ncbi:TPA: HBL/NHE enterotoxin family protein, partial [Bacillus thuringiensis]|uniref:Hemolysin BL lytic component L1 n=32 Tax=Bacillus TaxID=1386 RepID=A0A9W5PTK4_BACCE|nr:MULTISPECIES: HBL/NHE enterotoxin family protein [Bacillus]MDM5375570.1 HBL/NHE enterotoxin family protein [Bacillus bombysepticus]NIE92271.1 HBL/NHE enterotoxin family protein [Bacillus sp. Ab-1751]ACM18209.1 L1(a2) component [Bacillus thuringiensis serovar kurstaki]AGE78321.1 Tripartite hemolysin BL component L1 [Bacillus thuringiensis serovar kurstaki str. HD73]AHZ51380.1 Tripartite hemolysin BL component L1 [Bacillus thuringiensis serovar kurstaki str. YBT-1520]